MQLRGFGDMPSICYSVSDTVLKGIGEGVIEVQYLIELTRLINKGRCWVVVGAGASCDLGVPSWECLAKQVLAHIESSVATYDVATYSKYLEARKYPEMFSLAEEDLGGIDNLLEVVREKLVSQKPRGDIYGFLAGWPFACYLTTNFDDHLKDHLYDTGVSFVPLGNSEVDFRKIRDDTDRIIVKLHGSLDDPDNVVLTSNQYAAFRSAPGRQYFRRKLGYIFEMADVIIVGYSLGDPDIEFILEKARHFASPAHPIYMIAADISDNEANELYRTKNIRVISYPNPDGTHRALVQRVLPLMDRFIAPRVRGTPPIETEQSGVDDTAASLYIYSQARLKGHKSDFVGNALEALILRTVLRSSAKNIRSADELIAELPLPGMPEDLRNRAIACIEGLHKRDLLRFTGEEVLQLTESGQKTVEENQAQAELLREQVEMQIELDFKREFPVSAEQEIRSFVTAALQGLDLALKRRGLSVAACVFGGASPNPNEGLDVFSFLQKASNQLEKFEQRAYYIEYLAGVIAQPSALFKKYLSWCSQGHFAFHVLGQHQAAAQLRHEWLDSTVWILDSSVILPLLARNCYNHPYADDLFKRIRDLEIDVFTTHSLFEEVLEHAEWAIKCVDKYHTDSTEFMMIALLRGDYKQNLFIDGFVRTAAENPALAFGAYISSIFGNEEGVELSVAVEETLQRYNVQAVRFSEWQGFKAIDWGERPYWTDQIRQDRIAKGTYRSDAQCEAEAEVLILLLGERTGRFGALNEGVPSRAYFVTQSGVLRRVFPGKECPVWSPEALYRYLLLFPSENSWDSDAIYEVIRSDLFLAGIPVIDKHSYGKFFNPQINEANLRMEEARSIFHDEEASYLNAYSEFYDSLPDLDRPIYSLQVAWDIAQQEKKRADRVKKMAPLIDKERAELEQLRIDKKFREQRAKHKRRSIEQRKAHERPQKKS